MRTVMLVSTFNIKSYTKVIVVDIYIGINEMWFLGYSNENIAKEYSCPSSIGIWKIKKIK